jgi:hypothetical protein
MIYSFYRRIYSEKEKYEGGRVFSNMTPQSVFLMYALEKTGDLHLFICLSLFYAPFDEKR